MLAIDHGEARCGCAVSDRSGTVASPLEAKPPVPSELAALARELEAEAIVVGLPLTLRGEEGEQAESARRFAGELQAALASQGTEIPVSLHDERLTTAQASATRRAGADADLDSLAAAHLLESWLAGRIREQAE